MKSFTVYCLKEPVTDAIRYFGITGDFKHRMRIHLNKHTQTYCSRWIQKLLGEGQSPSAEVLMTGLTKEEAIEEEIALIAWGKEKGFRLTNITIGGDGTNGFSPRPETREKLKAINTGKKQSPETIEKRILKGSKHWTFGKLRDPETCTKISESLLGREQPEEMTEKILASKKRNRLGKVQSLPLDDLNFPGVSWDKARKKWVARIALGDKYKALGRFNTRQAAAQAVKAAVEQESKDSQPLGGE